LTHPEQLHKIAAAHSGEPIGNNIADVLDVIANWLDDQATLLDVAREMADHAVILANWHGWYAHINSQKKEVN
jgi:hypothetical protein